MPVEEEDYVNIDCLDAKTGEALPLQKRRTQNFAGKTCKEQK